MTVKELIEYLQSNQCPKDAKVRVCIPPPVAGEEYPSPQCVWWSDDRKTVYLGML